MKEYVLINDDVIVEQSDYYDYDVLVFSPIAHDWVVYNTLPTKAEAIAWAKNEENVK